MQMIVTKADRNWLARFTAKPKFQTQAARQRAFHIKGALAYRREYVARLR